MWPAYASFGFFTAWEGCMMIVRLLARIDLNIFACLDS